MSILEYLNAPSPVSAEVITPPGQPAILALTLDLDYNSLQPPLDLPALRQSVCDSIWPARSPHPQVYLSCYDADQRLITCAASGSQPVSLARGLSAPASTSRSQRWIRRTLIRPADHAPWLAEVVRSRLECSLTLEAAIDGWSRALALRDEETSAHTQRVTELVTRLSRKIGLPEEAIGILRRGARLHDIGKMGIPDKILLKPGPLNEEDWSLMQKHPLFAYEMLRAIPFVDGALDIPYCHHERWDGTGYPRGLKYEAIPLLARVFSVVDVWDALCSDRPYRKAWTRDRAIQYLVEQSGRQFDPFVTTAFLDMINENAIRQKQGP